MKTIKPKFPLVHNIVWGIAVSILSIAAIITIPIILFVDFVCQVEEVEE